MAGNDTATQDKFSWRNIKTNLDFLEGELSKNKW